MAGAFIAVVGPSGAGKDSVMDYARAVLEKDPYIEFIRRIVTRPAQAGSEEHDTMSVEEFEQAQKEGAFSLIWRAHGLLYGLPADIDAKISAGKIIIANVSRRVLAQIEDKYEISAFINITAQPEILAKRLAMRGRETEEDIAKRLSREVPISAAKATLIEIDNSGHLEDAGEAFVEAVYSFK